MNEHEEKFIASFIRSDKKERYKLLFESEDPKRKRELENHFNHGLDVDERYVMWLPKNPRSTARNEEIAKLLLSKGSPAQVFVFTLASKERGIIMALDEALDTIWNGYGNIISCIPGQLAYYFAEEGERRAILERKSGT